MCTSQIIKCHRDRIISKENCHFGSATIYEKERRDGWMSHIVQETFCSKFGILLKKVLSLDEDNKTIEQLLKPLLFDKTETTITITLRLEF